MYASVTYVESIVAARNRRAASGVNEKPGLKITMLRKEVFEQFEEWADTSCAASNLAVLCG
jgi:hypothetical protein